MSASSVRQPHFVPSPQAPSVPSSTSALAADSVRDLVLRGLRAQVKSLPPSLFYDAAGAALFEQICELPEYYPTRTELAILTRCAPTLARAAGPHVALIEYGSGAATKVRLLLDQLETPSAYVPVDVSHEQLEQVAAVRSAQYPGLRVLPVCADYTRPLTLPRLPDDARRVAFFPGSTIGNFHPTEASAFLHRVRHTVGPRGGMILGVDRRKDPDVLHNAYNDAAGVTAAFNRNLLVRMNRELQATFDVDTFRHVAFFNDALSRIEMHLESSVDQTVHVAGEAITFAAGETIHTECSYKYDEPRLRTLVEESGFRIEALHTDACDWFWVAWLTPI
ncbi:L-histidine N(alpha)-methyltransferase [Gemmatimonas sp.]|uniref:L-histidine N(alpha)-methyltransferase n=1 Tax=Gemmatimonas sp. TaxID=1962908 RepID=UPI003983781C